ncbi:MAG: acyl-CoA dehydrogenase [Acetobacteraceae bacterium]
MPDDSHAAPAPDGDSPAQAISDNVRRFVAQQSSFRRIREQRGQLPGHSRDIWRAMAEAGWFGVMLPEEAGGMGLGVAEAAALAGGLAAGLFPEPFTAAAVLPLLLLSAAPSSDIADELIPAILAGETLVAVAWQEDGNDIAPQRCATRAAMQGSDATLSGTKRFIQGGAGADGFLVTATGAEGLSLWWVPRDAPGAAVTTERLVDGTFGATLTLSTTRLPARHRIAASADDLARALDIATILAAAELLAVTQVAFDMTLEHLRTRKQFGATIGSFQALQHRAVDCGGQLEIAGAVLREAIEAADGGADATTRATLASRTKARCGDAAVLVVREGIQMFGAMGFTDELDLSLCVKRVLVLSAWLGAAHHHRRRFAALCPPQIETAQERARVSAQLRALPRDTDWNGLANAEFRALVRDFFETEYPDEYRHLPRRVRWHEVRDFNLKLAERGWIAPAWPRSAGGMALSPAKQLIYVEELERAGVGRAPDQGVRQLGPVLMRYGTEAQKAEYLPKILSCEHIWCQGYSEPGSGSDLASVATSAVREGDTFVINGQKIWTSLAMDSTHIYILCRTDPTRPKQQGLSFIIAPMDTPGITWRPIRNIAGDEEFCQVFLDDVRVPAANLVGELNQGWTVAKAVLGFERLGTGSPNRPLMAFNRLTTLARASGLFEDAGFVDDYTRLRTLLLDHATLYSRYAQAVGRGELLGHEVSYLKIIGMEAMQRATEFALERAGALGAMAGPFAVGDTELDLMAPFYLARMTTIGAGTSEINRNIVAKRVLRLPDR